MLTDNHSQYMGLALALAAKARGYTAPNPMVGCVLVNNQEVIGQGFHHATGMAHAEVEAINNAINNGYQYKLAGATCYVSLEPCCHYGKTGPCTDALIKAGIKEVYVACLDPNPHVSGKGVVALKQAGIKVYIGLKESEAKDLNQGFISRVTANKPYVRSKIAASLDAKIALHNGQSKWITNSQSRQDVHQYRLYSDAIVTTANTILADDPSLNCRVNEAHDDYRYIKQPLRVVIDKHLETCPESNIFNLDQNCIVVTLEATLKAINIEKNQDKLNRFNQLGIKVYSLGSDGSHNIDIKQLWELLAELGCNDIMIEAGSNFNGYLLKHNLVDEWVIYQSGILMGAGARPIFDINSEDSPFDSMQGLFKLKCVDVQQFGDNWRLICLPE